MRNCKCSAYGKGSKGSNKRNGGNKDDEPGGYDGFKNYLNYVTKQLDNEFTEIWKNSFIRNGNKVREWGFTIVQDENDEIAARNMKRGKGGNSRPNFTLKPGDRLIGFAHSHPYSKREGSFTGVHFSIGDIDALRQMFEQGYYDIYLFVEAGTKRFAMTVTNGGKAQKFFELYNNENKLRDLFEGIAGEGENAGRSEEQKPSLIEMLKDSGIQIFESPGGGWDYSIFK